MKKIISLILLLCSFTTWAKEFETFYLNPCSENLIEVLLDLPETNDKRHQLLNLIFISCVLREHPSYVNTIIDNYEKFSSDQKNIVTHALYIKEGKNIFKKLNIPKINFTDSFTFDVVDNVQLFLPETEADAKKQAIQLDQLWAAFFATGNKKYVNVMLDYIKKENNEPAINHAAGFLYRKASGSLSPAESDDAINDLLASLEKADPDNSKHLGHRFVFYTIIWWSSHANKQLPPMQLHLES